MSDMSLDDARSWLAVRLSTGAKCPCCSQFAKVYSRKINSNMARLLVVAYRRHGQAWFHISALGFPGGGGEFAKLRYWGVVETVEEQSGQWRVTDDGVDFVLGHLRLRSHADIYDGNLVALVGEKVDVRHALGDRFDYDELMATPGTPAMTA